MTTSEKVARFKKQGYEATFSSDKETVAFGQLYLQLTGEKICLGCGGKTKTKFDELVNMNTNQIKAMSERKFTMIPGKLIDSSMAKSGPIGQYTSANITDEVAIELLRHQKGWISFFKTFPENWKKVVADMPVPAAPEHKKAVDRSDAITAESEIEGNPSTEFLAKEAIALIDRLDNAEVVESFTADEPKADKPRKSVIKASKKRVRQLSE